MKFTAESPRAQSLGRLLFFTFLVLHGFAGRKIYIKKVPQGCLTLRDSLETKTDLLSSHLFPVHQALLPGIDGSLGAVIEM